MANHKSPRRKQITGREFVFTPEVLAKITEMGGLGFTKKQMCQYFGVPEPTWYRHENQNPAIEEAYHKGFIGTHALVCNVILAKAKEGNLRACELWMRYRGGWASEVKSTSDNLINARHNKLTLEADLGTDPIQAAKIYERLMMET